MPSDNPRRAALLKDWWERKNTAPLVLSYARVTYPVSGLDIDILPGQILERKLQVLEVDNPIPSDTLFDSPG